VILLKRRVASGYITQEKVYTTLTEKIVTFISLEANVETLLRVQKAKRNKLPTPESFL
jgi:hypothetical protein